MSTQHATAFPVEPIVLGKIGSAYGIHGWLRMFSSTENIASIFDYQPWFIKRAGQWQQLVLEDWRHHSRDLVIKLTNVDDRTAASQFTNCEIMVDASKLPALEAGDYYWRDLIGCQVVTTEGYQLGKVADIMETGANDVLVVRASLKDAFGMCERLLPFIDGQVIKQVDLATQTIEVAWDPTF